jgi:uncharacterized protein YbaR (Trm112 family)
MSKMQAVACPDCGQPLVLHEKVWQIGELLAQVGEGGKVEYVTMSEDFDTITDDYDYYALIECCNPVCAWIYYIKENMDIDGLVERILKGEKVERNEP